jgi:hypothetical protein
MKKTSDYAKLCFVCSLQKLADDAAAAKGGAFNLLRQRSEAEIDTWRLR